MPIGTQDPRFYPANIGPRTSTGAKYYGMEARAGKILDLYFLNREDTFTLVAPAPTVSGYDIEVDATHTIGVGDWIELYEDDVYLQAQALGVAGDTITLDTPIPFAFTVAGALGINGVRNAAVDADPTPMVFEVAPPAGQVWDVTKTSLFIEGATAAMTHSLFGDIAAIANGIVFRVKRSAAKYEILHNIKANVDLMIDTDATAVSAAMTAATFGLFSFKTFGNEGASGAMLRLDGDLGEKLELLIQDDIDALTYLHAKAHGYFLYENDRSL